MEFKFSKVCILQVHDIIVASPFSCQLSENSHEIFDEAWNTEWSEILNWMIWESENMGGGESL